MSSLLYDAISILICAISILICDVNSSMIWRDESKFPLDKSELIFIDDALNGGYDVYNDCCGFPLAQEN
jgi:hypothetical protein